MNLLLASVWIMLVMGTQPDSKQFEVDNVSFNSLDDCEAAARQWQTDMAAAIVRNGHARLEPRPADPTAPPMTYTCVERQN